MLEHPSQSVFEVIVGGESACDSGQATSRKIKLWWRSLCHQFSWMVHTCTLWRTVPGNSNLPAISSHLQYSGIHRTLTELHFYPGEGWIIDRISIAPLLVLGELTSLTISASCGEDQCNFFLSEKGMEYPVESTPKLETLSPGTPCPEQMPNNLTVKGRLAIAEHCKALKTLEMRINC
jgi:hypothetical protein